MKSLLVLPLLYLLNSPLFALWKGSPASEGDFPALVFFKSCTGTRIGLKHIITAAHCLDDSYNPGASISIYSGAIFNDALSFEHHISKTFIHPSYRENKKAGFDIAIIVLAEEIDSRIKTARISSQKLNIEDKVIIAGHGLTGPGNLEQRILEGDVVVSTDLSIEDDLHFAQTKVAKIEERKFITYAKKEEPSLGRGDSGGAVYLASDPDHLSIVGINSEANILSRTSYFARIDDETNPNIYNWIQRVLE